MAKVNFNVVLTKLEGDPLKAENGKDLTLADTAKQALLVAEEKQTGEQKYEAYVLATKVAGGGEVNLKSEEISKIKEAIGKHMFPVVVGQAWDLLEGKTPATIK